MPVLQWCAISDYKPFHYSHHIRASKVDPLPSFLFTSSVLPFDSKTQFCVQCNSHDGLLRWFHILDPLTPFPGGAFCLAFCCRSGLSIATQPFSFSFPSRVPSLSIVLRLRASFALRRSAPDFELPPFWPHVLPFRPWFGNLRYSHFCSGADHTQNAANKFLTIEPSTSRLLLSVNANTYRPRTHCKTLPPNSKVVTAVTEDAICHFADALPLA